MNSNLINNRDLHGTFLPQSLEAKTNLQSSLNPQINKDDNDAKDNFVSDNSSNSAPQRKKWLVMNYIAGDNSLKLKQLENIDHQELIGSDDQVDLTAFVDIGSLPVNFPLNESCYRWAGARTIHIIKDHSTNFLNAEVLEDHGREVDSSDWKNLKKFVVDMIKKYPADNVALIMNNHGTGFKGVLLDDEAGKFMQIPEIKRALTEAQEETGKKLDVIGFDACLMGELEVAYELKDVGNYMVASEETESTGGWCYIDILKGPDTDKGGNIANLSPLDFSKHIVNINRNNNCSIRTTSATDLNKIDGLKSAVDELAQSIIKSEDKEQIRKVFQNTEHFGGESDVVKFLLDINHLSKKLAAEVNDNNIKESAAKVGEALKDAVFENQANPNVYPNAGGLSIFGPSEGEVAAKEYENMAFTKDTHWNEALKSLGVKITEKK